MNVVDGPAFDAAIAVWNEAGSLPYHLRKPEEVTAQYEYLARWALENLPDPAFGTHDDHCIEVIKTAAQKLGIDKKDFEFQLLYGVRRPLQIAPL